MDLIHSEKLAEIEKQLEYMKANKIELSTFNEYRISIESNMKDMAGNY